MNPPSDKPIDRILHDLQERAKELNCLYRVDDLLGREDSSLDDALGEVIRAIPAGCQFPDVCVARIVLGNRVYEPPGFQPSTWRIAAPFEAQGEIAGQVEVYYTEAMPRADEGPFLAEERKLVDAVAERVGHFVSRRRLQRVLAPMETAGGPVPDWWVVLDFLRQTDRALLGRLGRKMINYLCWNGVAEAERLLREAAPARASGDEAAPDDNRPQPRTARATDPETTDAAFRIAGQHLPEDEILGCIHSWIKEDKSTFLKNALERMDTPLADLADALQRFRHGGVEERDLSIATQTGLRAALVRRFLTDQLEFVNIAKEYTEVADFHELTQHIVYPPRSHGRLGGKAAGLFLASKIVTRSPEYKDVLGDIRVPRSWHVPSDGILDFIHHNDLEDVYNRKYVDPDRVRLEYPYVVQLFKNSFFSPEILRGLSTVLDDLEGRPIIVRSSSLLEDRLGSAFSGKYKSLFLANAGGKRERMAALTDAIAEVYASVFSPDPIEYRALRGLLDLHEEMGILIQEVVGTRVGPYWMPAFSGVGFSNNEFRWSSRIAREDGLLRIVPGLGTRAVDRLADDYPVLIAPGQPGLRVNQTPEEALRYSPKKADVINLETGVFETVDMRELLERHGEELPLVRQMISIADHDHLRRPVGLVDFSDPGLVLTFEGLISDSPFVTRMRTLLQVLREKLKTPVDIEFASDGRYVYLLQCRPQGATEGTAPVPIPRDLPQDRVLFTAHRYVSNGQVSDVSHVVYVDPEGYARLELDRIREVGRAVGRLNRLLPKRQFILMGPGRWGSRGDIRLGVPVTYADISNAAVLVEVARKKGGYIPDLSFGTHFFQDLVESNIRYLPLYPDDPDVVFNEAFFLRSANALASLAPEFEGLSDVLRVIDVPRATGGRVLRVLMNGDLDEAVGLLAAPTLAGEADVEPEASAGARPDDHWRWRLRMAQRVAALIDAARFGVKAAYVFGSTKNGTAGPASDIDLLLHVEGDDDRRRELAVWLDGWSQSLAEVNYLRTGYQTSGLLDVHYVTDADIAGGTSPFAAKIGAVTDAARALPLGGGVATAGER
ncbi:MAG TPA: PEP/pyruvate-binding domain-containing protein [Vicinamibacteria bacterium]|nr:PEP/pyruvate-binding domain-containing protein [Vicinamibacteria bacterium]